MTKFETINAPRVARLCHSLDTIERSAKSQKASPAELAALLAPLLAAIEGLGLTPSPAPVPQAQAASSEAEAPVRVPIDSRDRADIRESLADLGRVQKRLAGIVLGWPV